MRRFSRPALWMTCATALLLDGMLPAWANEIWIGQVSPSAMRSNPLASAAPSPSRRMGPESHLLNPSGGAHALDLQQTGSDNRLAIHRTGWNHSIAATQSGGNNTIEAVTLGSQNALVLQQSGSDQAIVAIQSGYGNRMSAVQVGQGNVLRVDQR
ncbi:hypothetical protein ACLBWX_01860 [Methylobacterium sp. M6A4_1b]